MGLRGYRTDGGGEIVAIGRVADIIKEPRSHTGKFLREVLERRPGARLAAELNSCLK